MPENLTIIVRLEDGALWATVDELPGVFATGDTLDELHESLAEGIALYLAEPGEEPRRVELGPLAPAADEPVEARTHVALACA